MKFWNEVCFQIMPNMFIKVFHHGRHLEADSQVKYPCNIMGVFENVLFWLYFVEDKTFITAPYDEQPI